MINHVGYILTSVALNHTVAYRNIDLFMAIQIARMYSICLKFANCVSEISASMSMKIVLIFAF